MLLSYYCHGNRTSGRGLCTVRSLELGEVPSLLLRLGLGIFLLPPCLLGLRIDRVTAPEVGPVVKYAIHEILGEEMMQLGNESRSEPLAMRQRVGVEAAGGGDLPQIYTQHSRGFRRRSSTSPDQERIDAASSVPI